MGTLYFTLSARVCSSHLQLQTWYPITYVATSHKCLCPAVDIFDEAAKALFHELHSIVLYLQCCTHTHTHAHAHTHTHTHTTDSGHGTSVSNSRPNSQIEDNRIRAESLGKKPNQIMIPEQVKEDEPRLVKQDGVEGRYRH